MSDEAQAHASYEVPGGIHRETIHPTVDPAAPFHRILRDIPPRERPAEPPSELANMVTADAVKRSEARRDAILAVALAVKRRGQNPMTDWTTKDTDTAYAIAEQLIALA
jgi:hypothetical protein